VGHTQEAKQELLSMVHFERTEDVLNTVKPTRLIRRMLQIGTNRASRDVVMDFFAGSGTTADAVIRQNRYGLHVERLETWFNEKDKHTYRAVKSRNGEGRRVLVLWRDMDGLDPVEERRFLEAKLKTEDPFDEVLINGDTATPGARSLDGVFKRLLEEGEG
jgi:hypothetical protein